MKVGCYMNLSLLHNVIKTYDDFTNMLTYIQNEFANCYNTITECDKAICDIRHYCELNFPLSTKQKTAVVRLLHNYSVKRREAKDTIAVLKELNDFLQANRTVINKLNKVQQNMHSQMQRIQNERKYTPRVLHALFNGNITGGANSDGKIAKHKP